jgi:hypothetical protein
MSAAGKLVRETRIARTTGVTVEVVDADHSDCDDYQSDEGGRWVTVCREHEEFVQHETWKLARENLGHPEQWCESCMEAAEESGTGDSNGGFSEEERARAAETRRQKAAERQKAREEEEERRHRRETIEQQWSDWAVSSPMVESVYVGDEKERHDAAREAMSDAKTKAASAKRARQAAENSIETVTRLKIKSKREKKNLQRLEGEAAALDAEQVAQEDRAREADAEKTRLARIALLRGVIAAGWKLELGPPVRIVSGDRDLRVPDNYLAREDYAIAEAAS